MGRPRQDGKACKSKKVEFSPTVKVCSSEEVFFLQGGEPVRGDMGGDDLQRKLEEHDQGVGRVKVTSDQSLLCRNQEVTIRSLPALPNGDHSRLYLKFISLLIN